MPQRPRHDRYGRPLPHLAPATRQVTLTSERNTTLRHYLLRLLEEEYGGLFQRGLHAELIIHLRIADGMLQPDLDITVQRHHQFEREERRDERP